MTIEEIITSCREYYSISGNEAGGNLHVALDDGNLGDSTLHFCLTTCVELGDDSGAEIAADLLELSYIDRGIVYQNLLF